MQSNPKSCISCWCFLCISTFWVIIIIISFYFCIGLHNIKTISLNSWLTNTRRDTFEFCTFCSVFLQRFAQVILNFLSSLLNPIWSFKQRSNIFIYHVFFFYFNQVTNQTMIQMEVQTKLDFALVASSFISCSFLWKPFRPPFTNEVEWSLLKKTKSNKKRGEKKLLHLY